MVVTACCVAAQSLTACEMPLLDPVGYGNITRSCLRGTTAGTCLFTLSFGDLNANHPTIDPDQPASPAKATELFAKLVETSGNAVKTRERLFSELKEELELQMKLEEQHLFPVLKKHKETKNLVSD